MRAKKRFVPLHPESHQGLRSLQFSFFRNTAIRIGQISFFCLLSVFSFSQPSSSFGSDPAGFQKDIDDLLVGSKRDDGKQTAANFDAVWNSFSQQQQTD